MPDKPWVMRTYSGHSSARASNELYRTNLAKGQTGLSIAFDLPTQTGYDPDAPEAAGEVGKDGVPVAHLAGTTQNDIVKEYLSRGTYIFPPEPSRRLIVDTIAWTAHHSPKW